MSEEQVTRTTVSVDPNVMRMAKRRMRALGIRKFSQYVGLLLEKDQREGGSLTIVKEEASPYRVKEQARIVIPKQPLPAARRQDRGRRGRGGRDDRRSSRKGKKQGGTVLI